jgi:hypothetical protein
LNTARAAAGADAGMEPVVEEGAVEVVVMACAKDF